MSAASAPSPRPASAALRSWGAVVLWMAVISTLSGDPFSARNTGHYIDPVLRWLFPGLGANGFLVAHSLIRKSAHFLEFFVLGALCYRAFRAGRPPAWQARRAAQAIAVCAAWALLDEAHQAFVVSRTASLFDSAVDGSGALAAQLVIFLRHRGRDTTARPGSTGEGAREPGPLFR